MPKAQKIAKVSLEDITRDIKKAINEITKAEKKLSEPKLKKRLGKTVTQLKKIDKLVRAACVPASPYDPPGGHMIGIPQK